MKRKFGLIESNIFGEVKTAIGNVIASGSAMRGTRTEINSGKGAIRKFVVIVRGDEWPTFATEDTKVRVCRLIFIK